MRSFLLRRTGLSLLSLWLLSLLVFIGTNLLPGDVGRRMLGPFATQEAVDTLNETLGTDRPLPVQYWDWISGVVVGDFGVSQNFARPVTELLLPALSNSAKLAAFAFVIVVPLSVLGGVIAALRRDTVVDRLITVTSLSATVIPEFVSGIILTIVFSVTLGWFPSIANAPEGASFLTQLRHLVLPALPLVLVLFGYIARIARAGVIEALEADYTRTAILKGLPRRVVIRRHVLRNALMPTVAVVATQTGFLIGGLVVVEQLFTYPGVGRLMLISAERADFPLLGATVLTVGATFQIATLIGDLIYGWLNPRIHYGKTV